MWRGASPKTKALVIFGSVAVTVLLLVLFGLVMLAMFVGSLLLLALVLGWGKERKKVIDEEAQTTAKRLPQRSPIDPRPSKSLLNYQKRTLDGMRKSQEDALMKTKKRFWG